MNIVINGTPTEALPYAFPKKGRARIRVNVDGAEAEAVITGGGKWPEYTYFKLNGDSLYIKGALAEGAQIQKAAAEPVKAEPQTPEVAAKELIKKVSKKPAKPKA